MPRYLLLSKYLDTLLRKFMTFGNKPIIKTHRKLGRNESCRCGCGKKYKHCCWSADYQRGNL